MAPDTFDELLTYLGTGWWNVLYIAALSFRLMLLPSQSISVVYLAPWQDHICIPDPAYMNITVSREACHYVIEKKLAKVGSDDREGGDGEARELVEMPCTQWDFNTTTFTSTLTSEFGWVCEREHLRAVYQSVYMLSTAVTPLLSGFLADRFGRLKVLVASHVALSVTSISICFLHSAPLIFLLRFFSGSSELLTGLVLTLEVCEQRHRAAVGVLTGLAWSAGTMLWGGLAFFIREWRALQLVASLPTLIAFPLLYFMDESPRWLIVRGQYKRASQVLKKAARWNKKTLPPQDQLNDLFVRICREGTEEKRGSKEYIKKTRKPNWSSDETLLLVQQVQLRKMIVNGRFTPYLSNHDKHAAWMAIVDALNSAFPQVRRTVQECETRWFSVLSKTRKKLSALNREYTQSGAGGPTAPPLDAVEVTIQDILGGKYALHCTLVGVQRKDYTMEVIHQLEQSQSREAEQLPVPPPSPPQEHYGAVEPMLMKLFTLKH